MGMRMSQQTFIRQWPFGVHRLRERICVDWQPRAARLTCSEKWRRKLRRDSMERVSRLAGNRTHYSPNLRLSMNGNGRGQARNKFCDELGAVSRTTYFCL